MPELGRRTLGLWRGLRLPELLERPEVPDRVNVTTDLDRYDPWPRFGNTAQRLSLPTEVHAIALWAPQDVLLRNLRLNAFMPVANWSFEYGYVTSPAAWDTLQTIGTWSTPGPPDVLNLWDGGDGQTDAEFYGVIGVNADRALWRAQLRSSTWYHQTGFPLGCEFRHPYIGNNAGIMIFPDAVNVLWDYEISWEERPNR